MEIERGHCVMETDHTAFTDFVMGFVVIRVIPVVTVGASWGAHEDRMGGATPDQVLTIMPCILLQGGKKKNLTKKKNL